MDPDQSRELMIDLTTAVIPPEGVKITVKANTGDDTLNINIKRATAYAMTDSNGFGGYTDQEAIANGATLKTDIDEDARISIIPTDATFVPESCSCKAGSKELVEGTDYSGEMQSGGFWFTVLKPSSFPANTAVTITLTNDSGTDLIFKFYTYKA